MANDVLNETPHLQDKAKQTAQQIFSKTAVQTNPKHWKPLQKDTSMQQYTLTKHQGCLLSGYRKQQQRKKLC
jgi:hypothetical protein